MSDPAITVVSAALNSARTLPRAIRSLEGQGVPYEWILVDGGSKDDTMAIAAAAPQSRPVSFPGSSIYDAWNRGIEQARAPLVVLLNTDDTLVPGALAAWLAAFDRAPQAAIARGWATFEQEENDAIRPLPDEDARSARPLDLHILLRGACAINTMCVRKTVFDRIGTFDCSFRLAADREWMLRAWVNNVATVEIARPVYHYLVHVGSATLDRERRNFALIRSENMTYAERYLTGALARQATPETSRALRRWYAAEAAMLMSQQARSGDWHGAAATVRRAIAQQPLWPLMAGREFGRWAWKRLG